MQRPPAEGAELSAFPFEQVRQGTLWYRAHRRALGPWFYACSGDGRFDLSDPDGICYLAGSAENAAREVIGPDIMGAGAVPSSFVAQRQVSFLLMPREVKLAHVSCDGAFPFGITGELTTMDDFGVPQQWAEAFHAHGFGGVRYRPRFSPRGQAWCRGSVRGSRSAPGCPA
ncbi:RES family NAD+ phosphorylase [Brevibacterium album]|uniref:RES family NAD+ phosphorylase n=1 Tax=Brevibacterium album TaxID=417948 RepID=UPI003CCBF0AF